MRRQIFWLLLVLSLPAFGAELTFDFSKFPPNETPSGFTSLLYGKGQPGDWKVVMEAEPPAIAPATAKAPMVTRRAVLSQLKQDPTDERFPLLVYDGETFGDFTLTTQLKITGGGLEQVAGIAFRLQNETNFYVIRANAMDNNLRFYKVVDGTRSPMLGPSVPVPLGEWLTLKIECRGNEIRAWFNGKEAIKLITDTSFMSGKIGYWTKSDSLCSFGDTHITYQPRQILAQSIVDDLMKKYSRLYDLKIYMLDEQGEPRVVASKNPQDLGSAGDNPQKQAIARGAIFVAKNRKDVSVVLPVRDKNGDPMAAVVVDMESFRGQTRENAIIRATPIVQAIQARAHTPAELKQ